MSERIVVVDQLVKDFAVRGGEDGAALTALDSVKPGGRPGCDSGHHGRERLRQEHPRQGAAAARTTNQRHADRRLREHRPVG